MTCEACKDIRTHLGTGPIEMGFPNCIHCAARRIQFIQRRMQISKEAKVQKCREALTEAVSWGHAEGRIRELAKSTNWAVEPAKGK